MIDLNKLVNDALVKLEEEKFIEQVVQKRLEKTIEDIIDDTFRSWSDFGKNLKEHINNNLNIDLKNLKLQEYNTLVLKAVQEELDKNITVQGIDKIKESVNEMLNDVKPEYELSEIISKLKDENIKEEYEYDEDDQIDLIIEEASYGYVHIYMQNQQDSGYSSYLSGNSKYSYDYQIDLDKEGKPYSVKFKGKEIDTKKICGGLYGLDRLLFKIYASGSKIILDHGTDADNYDLYYRDGDDY